MPWFRIDDGFADHPKVMRAGNAAVGVWVRCGASSARYLTDGHIDADVARSYGRTADIERLLTSRLWIENGEGFLMPDYLEYNPSREQVLAERAAARERQRRHRRRADGRFE